jgi:hypothetical protein
LRLIKKDMSDGQGSFIYADELGKKPEYRKRDFKKEAASKRQLLLVRPARAITIGCKSRTRLDSRKRQLKARVSTVRWNLKEAGGKVPA